MNIAHLCLSCFYYDGFSYQENLLVQQNVKDGHNVQVIASTESIDSNGRITFVQKSSYMGGDGALVNRVPYNKLVPKIIQYKIKSYDQVFTLLKDFAPDIIYFHGISAVELLSIKKFKIQYPNVKLILDCHSDKYNSATNFLSKNILHSIIYRTCYQSILPFVDKVFCISLDTMDFAIDFYGTPEEKVEFFPLGGECLEDEEYFDLRTNIRLDLNISESEIMILQTGKINAKKKAIESILQFKKVNNSNLVYVIAGSLEEDVKTEILKLISSDNRIRYLGWVDSVRLKGLLCASDLYLQPGSQSATMQQSICLRNPIILDNVKSHKPFVDGNGWLINNIEDIYRILDSISENSSVLSEMSKKSYQIAINILDYRKLAKKIYSI
ncbi:MULTISPECIES: glycosyltransferase [Psychrobacter]|uniref:Glycosyl transferase family 1 n=1 Tax=Psychrobacter alimentarius TaxID=261164 RepID=A0ABN4N1U4_9GAMM|nr:MULTISPECIES: glycosyltransferase [Psychrobacter]AMT96346.1 Glycosyl transferase family 1 [Psychrobacter alimentarius]QCB31257.1 glycosyl transferase family 1 [Psychrobacter sp. PAMC27889]